MAPHAADIDVHQPPTTEAAFSTSVPAKNPVAAAAPATGSASRLTGPLTYSGSLDSFEQFDVTYVIGREFPKLQLSEILDDDTKIRDLAILGMRIPSFFPPPHNQETPKSGAVGQ